MSKWVSVFGNAMSISDLEAKEYAKNITLSYPILMPMDGSEIQLTFDNFTGLEEVMIDKITLSKSISPMVSEDVFYEVLFDGKEGCKLSKGQQRRSDSIKMIVNKGDVLRVSFYLKDYTSLRCGVAMAYSLGKGYYSLGDQSHCAQLDSYITKETMWMYFLSRIDVKTNDSSSSLICFGDSITGLSWPDYVQLFLMKKNINVGVVRKGVAGSRVLQQYDCLTYAHYGIKGTTRFPREIEAEGADKIIILQGINDLIHPVGVEVNEYRPWSDLPSAQELIEGLKEYIHKANQHQLKVYLGTLSPIKGWRTYEDFRNDIREEVNQWIRTCDLIQGYIDFDEVLKDPNDPKQLNPLYDSGDHLHPNDNGLLKMAEEVMKVLY
ncbi:MAG: GDSL-type esterase/lipase family protein [Traorella sp.]